MAYDRHRLRINQVGQRPARLCLGVHVGKDGLEFLRPFYRALPQATFWIHLLIMLGGQHHKTMRCQMLCQPAVTGRPHGKARRKDDQRVWPGSQIISGTGDGIAGIYGNGYVAHNGQLDLVGVGGVFCLATHGRIPDSYL